jgi:hypothetical protein
MGMRVLVACEYSGTVRDAFAKLGHYAMSCDLLPTDAPGNHYQGNVFDIIDGGWDLMIAHPPCTYLTNAGVCWLKKDPARYEKMIHGAMFFKTLLNYTKIPKRIIENPIMHKYAVDIIGRRQDQVIQPWMFGHTESKATCLWLEGVEPLKETYNVKEAMKLLPKNQQQKMHYLPPSADRWRLRSKTYQGIADALAQQYGKL